MFRNFDFVLKVIGESISSTGFWEFTLLYLQGCREETYYSWINRYFAYYPGQITCFNSPWVAIRHGNRFGPNHFKQILKTLRQAGNKLMDEWLLEMWYIALLCQTGVRVTDVFGVEETWPSAYLNWHTDLCKISHDSNRVWLKAEKWNEVSYDAIFVDKTKRLIRFVQISRGESHSLKLEYFSKFVKMVRDSYSLFYIDTVDIVVVEKQDRVGTFKITDFTGHGLLADFCWEEGRELDQVKVVGIESWDD